MVGALWRYPVKSMRGEPIAVATITHRGVDGDRAWALRECAVRRARERADVAGDVATARLVDRRPDDRCGSAGADRFGGRRLYPRRRA